MMPAKGLRLRCHLLTLLAAGVLVPAGVKAQESVTLKATVSETVTLSVAPNSIDGDVVNSSGNTVRITLSGAKSPVIRVPLLVRSNTGFQITAVFESEGAVLSELSVLDVRPTGRLVSPHIVNVFHAEPQLDPDTSQPLFVVSGPRVSLGGTLNSPNNALQITVLIRLKSKTAHDPLHLTFVALKQM
jgi:hypothetical protein